MMFPRLESDSAAPETGNDLQANMVPRCCTLQALELEAGCCDGVALGELAAGTTLVMRTRNSEYRLVVIDGPSHAVLVRGGIRIQDPTKAYVQGSGIGGSFVKAGWIGVGLRVEMLVAGQRMLTSAVESLTIENVPPPLQGVTIPA